MAQKDHLIMTATGADQVGLVEKISEFISQRSCNIEDSKMAVFYGEFAIILLITGDSGDLSKLAAGIRELETETRLSIATKRPGARPPVESSLPYRLTASCMAAKGYASATIAGPPLAPAAVIAVPPPREDQHRRGR